MFAYKGEGSSQFEWNCRNATLLLHADCSIEPACVLCPPVAFARCCVQTQRQRQERTGQEICFVGSRVGCRMLVACVSVHRTPYSYSGSRCVQIYSPRVVETGRADLGRSRLRSQADEKREKSGKKGMPKKCWLARGIVEVEVENEGLRVRNEGREGREGRETQGGRAACCEGV
jgi:hypothetical protein